MRLGLCMHELDARLSSFGCANFVNIARRSRAESVQPVSCKPKGVAGTIHSVGANSNGLEFVPARFRLEEPDRAMSPSIQRFGGYAGLRGQAQAYEGEKTEGTTDAIEADSKGPAAILFPARTSGSFVPGS